MFVPRVRSDLLSRPRLIERIEGRNDHKLTLVAAPAGFGKTVLLSDWARQAQKPVAWLSLDAYDNDPARFYSYLAAALKSVDMQVKAPSASASLLSGVEASLSQPASQERALTALISEVEAMGEKMALVFDDYHTIETPLVHDATAFLIEHLPSRVQFIIATRSDTHLPVGRLRAQGQLAKVGASALRFTAGETGSFLRSVTDRVFSEEDVTALGRHTEGWAAGLQLASLTLREEAEVDEFTQVLTGQHQHIDQYLTDEVFRQQPEEVRSFLLCTCILDRLSAPLCNAVTERSRAHSMLRRLEASGLFLTPLDNQQCWYRYHHLFRDFLRSRLRSQRPKLKPRLHRRACQWFAQEGLIDEAVTHAIAGEDDERAATLIEQNAEAILKRGEVFTLQSWLDNLPDALVRQRPHLGLLHAWVLILTGHLDAVEPRVWDVECELRRHSDLPFWLSVADTSFHASGTLDEIAEAFEGVEASEESAPLGELAAIQGTLARLTGDTNRSVTLCRQALDLLSEENLIWRGIALLGLGAAHGLHSDFNQARQALRRVRSLSRTSEDTLIGVSALRRLAHVQKMQGQLHQASDTYRQALQLISERDISSPPGAGYVHTGLGNLFYEWNDLETASCHFDQGLEQGQRWGTVGMLVYGHCGRFRLRQAQGCPKEAAEELEEAKQLTQRYNYEVAQVNLWETRFRISQGDLEAVKRWSRHCTTSADEVPSHLHEFKLITLARAQIALGAGGEALPQLEKIRRVAQKAQRLPSVIEALLLQALAHHQQGHSEKSIEALTHALSLARPEQYRRLFLDQGNPMKALLQEALSVLSKSPAASAPGTEPLSSYASELLEALMAENPSSSDVPAPGDDSPVESLSERELEVLELIAQGLKNQEIAEELFIATSTIKWHNQNIYDKLDVQNRTQAAERARCLDLL